MASSSKLWLPDVVRRCLPFTRRRTRSDSSPASSPTYDNSPPTELISTQAVPTPSITPLPRTTRVSQAAQVGVSPTRSAASVGTRGRKTRLAKPKADVGPSLRDGLGERYTDDSIKDLSPVHDAYYNAALPTSVTKRVGCTPGTRVMLLETVQDWAHGGNPAQIYWLNGMAGTGKTTIAYTLCEMLEKDKLLGASFFCSRNSPDCQDVNRIVPTIAYQLAQYSKLYQQEVLKALKSYSDIPKRDIGAQFRHLISTPFEKISRTTTKDIIVVIDALDECADEAGTRIVLDMLIRHGTNLPAKFFVASRPEPAISHSMETRSGALRSIFWLHDIEKSLVQADIKLYLTEALASISISPSEIDQLTDRAGNLFIFAATTVRYILPDRGVVNQRQRLQAVLKLQASQKHRSYQDIDNLYAAILVNALDENIYEEEEISARRQVLQTVICARESLTIPALAEILRVSDEENVLIAIQPLQSLLYVSAITSTVSALHASFPDFLRSEERAGQLYCDEVLQSSQMAECCFRLMERSLKFNMCELGSSYVFDRDVPDLQCRVDKAISTGLSYSCRYWADHLTSAPPSFASRALLGSFLQQHLLFWMEVLNLKGRIGHGEVVLSQVLTWLPLEDEWAELRDFTYDARNFVTSFAGNPTSLSTPHLYVSILPFTSKDNRVWTTYWKQTRGLIEVEGAATKSGGRSALATWVVGGMVQSIAQSSDGKHVASGSNRNEVSVWEVSSGARVLGPLEGHEGHVYSVVFSPDNSRIASGSRDGTIRVWDAHSGNLVLGPLRGHKSWVLSVAFSPDGTYLASGSKDHTIRMWDAHTGAATRRVYKGHSGTVWSVAFSSSGEYLASGSADHTIRVWHSRTGVAALKLMKGHTGSVKSIACSPDGLHLASGSDDCTVRVWDMSSGTLLAGPFEAHTREVISVSFSFNGTQVVSGSIDCTIRVWGAESGNLLAGPFKGHGSWVRAVLATTDGTRILSGSDDGTICVWDTRQGAVGQTESLGHSSGIRSVVVSPDGTRAASGSSDMTVCVWDTHSGTLVTGPFKGHTGEVTSIAFSPDGARIASGSVDTTLRTWDASTGALLAGPSKGHIGLVYSVAFSPDGSQIASGSSDCTIQLWDSHTGKSVVEPFGGHTGAVTSVVFSPSNGARIVSGSWDKTVRMWDTNDGTMLWTSGAHTNAVFCVVFSFDGTRVVSGSANRSAPVSNATDKNTLVFNAADGAVLHDLFTGHTNGMNSVAFSPDGTRIVSGSVDKAVRVWDMKSGVVVVGPLKRHTGEVTSVAFSPDGARIISGSADGTIRFWDVAAATRPGWSIDNDGWLIDSRSRRLFWVPSDLRKKFGFLTSSNPLVINASCATRVDNNTLLGDRWHECYI